MFMSNLEGGPDRKVRKTGIYAVASTIARPSVGRVETQDRMRHVYLALAREVRDILAGVSQEARACAFPIVVDGIIYLFSAELEEGGSASMTNDQRKLVCRFVVAPTGDELVAEEGYIQFPANDKIHAEDILTFNLHLDFPLQAIVSNLAVERSRTAEAAAVEQVRGMMVRQRRMTTMDVGAPVKPSSKPTPRKATSFPLSESAERLAVYLIARKEQYKGAPSRVRTTLRGGVKFEVMVRRIDEGLWVLFRYPPQEDFSAIFVPLNFARDSYIRTPDNPPWDDLIFALGIK